MNTWKTKRQGQLVGYLPHKSKNLKRANKSQTQLPSLPKLHYTLHRRNFEQNLLPYHELHISNLSVCVFLKHYSVDINGVCSLLFGATKILFYSLFEGNKIISYFWLYAWDSTEILILNIELCFILKFSFEIEVVSVLFLLTIVASCVF